MFEVALYVVLSFVVLGLLGAAVLWALIRFPDDLDAVWRVTPRQPGPPPWVVVLVLLGCIAAVVAVKATDQYFAPTNAERIAARAKLYGDRCEVVDGTIRCYPVDKR